MAVLLQQLPNKADGCLGRIQIVISVRLSSVICGALHHSAVSNPSFYVAPYPHPVMHMSAWAHKETMKRFLQPPQVLLLQAENHLSGLPAATMKLQ